MILIWLRLWWCNHTDCTTNIKQFRRTTISPMPIIANSRVLDASRLRRLLAIPPGSLRFALLTALRAQKQCTLADCSRLPQAHKYHWPGTQGDCPENPVSHMA